MVRVPNKHTDDAIALMIAMAYIAGRALEPHGMGFDIPIEVVTMVLAWAFRGMADGC